MKRKLAFVVQRYGLEVNGGAELLSRQLVEHLQNRYDIEVLTTKAVEYTTWKNEYTNDIDVIHGVTVRRFGVDKPRDLNKFGKFSGKVIGNPAHTMEQEEEWFEMQGPHVPQLIQYIQDHAEDYEAFIFMTYLYYTTVKGLPKVKDKAILISTAHDEPPIYLKTFEKLFQMPKAFFYLTVEEKKFVERKFRNSHIINNDGLGGSGVEVPEKIDSEKFKTERSIPNYMVYAGRIDEAKGCKELFDYFLRYKKENDNDLKLVMMGKPVIPIPKSDDIISLGFVSDQEKFDVMSGAKFLIMPSPFESLSIVVLEAMTLSVPVIVNGRCDVLKGHCVRSNGGLYYQSYYEFEGCINYMLQHKEIAEAMGKNGRQYVNDNYTWDKIVERFVEIVEQVCGLQTNGESV